MTLEEEARLLTSFGLTYGQAKIFAAIVHLGLAPVSAISKVSKARREEIYRSLPVLEKIGLIEKVAGSPTQIKALPIEGAIQILMKREQEKTKQRLSDLLSKRNEFLEHFRTNDREREFAGFDPQFTLTQDRMGIFAKTIHMLRTAQASIDIITSKKKLLPFLAIFSDHLNETLKRRVKIRIITESDGKDIDLQSVRKHVPSRSSLELKFAADLPGHYLVIDDKETLIDTSTEARLAESSSLWTNNFVFIKLTKQNFDEMWRLN